MAMRMLDAFFVHPRGWRGRVGGAMMEPVHAGQERWALRCPEVAAGARVLAVGYGTGQGLALAAAAVSPGGVVVGVEPSAVMQRVAARRCATQIAAGVVVLRVGAHVIDPSGSESLTQLTHSPLVVPASRS